MFDNRLLALLNHMIQMPHLDIWKLSVFLNQSVKSLESDIHELNDTLEKLGFLKIAIKDGEYQVPESLIIQKIEIQAKLKNSQIFLQEDERQHLIYLYTFIRKENISNYHYQELLQVSKNTTLSDINKLRTKCSQYNIYLKYTRSNGYYLEGEELDKRRMAAYCISSILQTAIGPWALNYIAKSWNEELKLDQLQKMIENLAGELQIKLVEDRLRDVVGLIYFIYLRQKRVKSSFTQEEKEVLQNSSMNQISSKILSQFFHLPYSEDEVGFITRLLLGIAEGNTSLYKDEKFYQLTEDIINTMEQVAMIEFEDKEALRESLYMHVVPTFYRLLFGMKLENSMVNQIKREHKELFVFVKQALVPLQKMLKMEEIPDEEIAYFTIHFGGQFKREIKKTKTYHAIVICPNGISSSLILISELKQLFPQIHWLGEHSVNELKNLSEESYDMIFSTVYIRTDKKLYIVKPIMNQTTKNYLLQNVMNDFKLTGLSTFNVQDLMKIIKKHAILIDEEKLYKDLSKRIITQHEQERDELPMLEDLITEDMIQFSSAEGLSWESAIKLSSRPLIKKKYIEESYTDAIIDSIREHGAYIDLGQGIAIPHARPETGVNQLGMTFLKLDRSVCLLDEPNHAVDMIITLAAIDNKSHLKALSQLTKILSDGDRLKALKAARTKQEVLTIIKEKQEVN